MDSRDLKLTKEVWRKLHHTPELSGQETKTKEILKEYLTNYTTLSVVETPDYLYTVYEEKDCEQPAADNLSEGRYGCHSGWRGRRIPWLRA